MKKVVLFLLFLLPLLASHAGGGNPDMKLPRHPPLQSGGIIWVFAACIVIALIVGIGTLRRK